MSYLTTLCTVTKAFSRQKSAVTHLTSVPPVGEVLYYGLHCISFPTPDKFFFGLWMEQ